MTGSILDSQACGENNFTIKTLGLLAHRPDLLHRFASRLTGSPVKQASIVYFSRVGENMLREWIEREHEVGSDDVQRRLNLAAGLPAGFRWRRNADGQLTQPAKWQRLHIDDMLRDNGLSTDAPLRAELEFLQDCLNTEPDIVVELRDQLVFVEIKVLSGEGHRQGERQLRLGHFLSKLMGFRAPEFALIGPEWGGRPLQASVRFHSWSDVADWFSEIPTISRTIRETLLHYGRQTCTMSDRFAESARGTFGSRFPVSVGGPEAPRQAAQPIAPRPVVDVPKVAAPAPSTATPTVANVGPWHFSHLGGDYFREIARGCRSNGVWPLRHVWLGVTGVAFDQIHQGRKINPNWMVEDARGQRRTRTGGFGQEARYDASKMREFKWSEIAARYAISD